MLLRRIGKRTFGFKCRRLRQFKARCFGKSVELLDFGMEIILTGFQQLGIDGELIFVSVRKVNLSLWARTPCVKKTRGRLSGPALVVILPERKRSTTSSLEKIAPVISEEE